jgi:hypothetical protein
VTARRFKIRQHDVILISAANGRTTALDDENRPGIWTSYHFQPGYFALLPRYLRLFEL